MRSRDDFVARRSTKTHRSSASDSSTNLTFGESTLHSSVTGRVPVAVSPSPSQLQGRDSLRLAPAYVLLAGVIAAAAIFYGNSLLGFSTLYESLAAAIVAIMVVRGLFGWQQRRFANQLFRQLPDTIELVTSTVRSGLPVNEAFRTISREMPQPTAGQFAIVCSELSLGRPPEEAVEDVYRRTQVAEYGMFAVTLAVQMKSGGSLTETLQTLGDTVRQRVAMAARAKALAGEVIFSSRALSCAPVIVGGLLYYINPETVDLLFYDPTGRTLLAYAVASVIIGSLVIRWMIRRDTVI